MREYNNDFYEMNLRRVLMAPIPAQTESYTPVPHLMFLGLLKAKIIETGNEIDSQKIYANETGTKLVGYFNVRNNEATANDLGMQMMAGYKNSYDKSMVAGFAAGANVIVCGNGMVRGDLISFKRKHTGTIVQELTEMFNTGIQKMTEGFHRLIEDATIMRDYDLTERQKAEILGVMYFEKEIVKPDQISRIKHQFKHSENFRGNSLWDLYNNVTESLKSSYVMNHIDDHIRLHDFMLEIAGVTDAVIVETPAPIAVPETVPETVTP
jgi:hypothetical protein